MKVVLLENITNLGQAGDIVEVKPGYARNFLIPRKMASALSKNALAKVEEIKRVSLLRAEREFNAAKEIAQKIESHVITITGKVGERGLKLYGRITTQQIADALKSYLGAEVDKRKISIPEPIRTLGLHYYTIKLHPKIVVEGKIEVVKPES